MSSTFWQVCSHRCVIFTPQYFYKNYVSCIRFFLALYIMRFTMYVCIYFKIMPSSLLQLLGGVLVLVKVPLMSGRMALSWWGKLF